MTIEEREQIKQQYQKVCEMERIEGDIKALECTIRVLENSPHFIVDWERTLSNLVYPDEYSLMLTRKVLHDYGNKYLSSIRDNIVFNLKKDKQVLTQHIEQL